MAATLAEFKEWRDFPLTQEFLNDVNTQVGEMVGQIINAQDSNPQRDQFLKGVINGLSQAVGWKPDIIEESVEGEYLPADEE